MTSGLLGILLWVIGLPLGTCLVLRENKHILQRNKIKSRLGFLYNGFREQRYYWEMIGVLSKAWVAGVSVFFIQAGTLVQSFLLMALLIFSGHLASRLQPYERPIQNSLEQTSLAALIASVFAGLFFLAARDSSSPFFQNGKDCKIY